MQLFFSGLECPFSDVNLPCILRNSLWDVKVQILCSVQLKNVLRQCLKLWPIVYKLELQMSLEFGVGGTSIIIKNNNSTPSAKNTF